MKKPGKKPLKKPAKKRNRVPAGPIGSYIRRRSIELASPAVRATNDPLAEWAERKVRLDGRPFSFKGHEYLRSIYDDPAQHIILSKAAQIGGTVWALLRAAHACLNGLNCLYFFPTKTDVNDFSRARVGPFLADNPFLSRKMKDTDTVGLKKIGDAHLYFRGMQSTVGMKSVPADLVVFDELDEATPDARTLALERLAHSSYKRTIELSNPSLPNYGIDAMYEKSDQRHWNLKCPACGNWTCLEREFPVKLHQEVRIILPRGDGSFFRACIKCGRELDLSAGEWVADFPNNSISGYRISQLFSALVDPGDILREYQACTNPDRFFTLKIGIPWADLERRLDIPTVLACCRTEPAPLGFNVMGVDTGKRLHAVILQTNQYSRTPAHIVHLAELDDYASLDDLMRRFAVQCCVIDAMPEIHAARDFARRHRHTYVNFFAESQRGSAAWDSSDVKVTINRTEALDASRAAIRDKLVTLPSLGSRNVELFARHMASDAKILETDEDTGAKKYKYIRTGEDHFSLAFTYAWMALDRVTLPMHPAVRAHLARIVSF